MVTPGSSSGPATPGRRLAAFSSVEIEPRYPSLVGLASHPPERRRTLDELPGATTSLQAMGQLADNLARVRDRIEAACQGVGRDPASVRLMAVSKTHGPERVEEAYAAGVRLFGENRVQEAAEKAEPVSYTHLTLPTTPYV